MPLAAGLRGIVNPDVVLPLTGNDGIELQETAREVDMRVRIVGLPTVFIAIRLESGDYLPNISNGSWRQICDYLIVVESGDRTHAVFVELKKTQSKKERPREQLRRSLPLLEYLRSMWEIESGSTLDERRLSVHYSILFEQTSPKLAKQSVNVKPTTRMLPEEYKGITIRTFVGTPVPLATLIGE